MFKKILQLQRLVDIVNTGSPLLVAKKMKISKSCLYQYIEELKRINVDIRYSKKQQTFYFHRAKK